MKIYSSSASFNDDFSLNEAFSKKTAMLPPPPIPSLKQKFDNVSFLKKNLMKIPLNESQNTKLKDEFQKIIQMNKDLIDSQNSDNKEDTLYQTISNIDDEFEKSFTNLEKLKENLIPKDRNFSIKFNKFPKPNGKYEINRFCNNIMQILNELINNNFMDKSIENFNEDLLKIKYALQIRFNDYKNNGLNEKYFCDALINMQDDLMNTVSNICKQSNKEEIIKFNTYKILNKKRKRSISRNKSLSEMKSVTSSSSSFSDD